LATGSGGITDSAYYEAIAEQHKADVMVIHTVLLNSRAELPHLSVADAERIIREAKPASRSSPLRDDCVASQSPGDRPDMTQRLGTEVQAAHDGMSIDL